MHPTVPDTSPATSLIQRACDAAWADPGVEKTVRMEALTVLQAEHMRDIAPAMANREQALGLGCLLLDLGLAVFHGRKFLPGTIRRTPGLDGMTDATVYGLLDRHVKGDWGDCRPNDAEANEIALRGGGRLLSVYKNVRDGEHFWVKVWVITDADMEQRDGAAGRLRLSTTVMLPSEY